MLSRVRPSLVVDGLPHLGAHVDQRDQCSAPRREFPHDLQERLLTTEQFLVPVQALANMSHDPDMEVKAPVGPPSITHKARSDARKQLRGEGAAIADADPLMPGDQSRFELEVGDDGKSSPGGASCNRSTGHWPIAYARTRRAGNVGSFSRARSDRRMAPSTAKLVPDAFADYFDREEVISGTEHHSGDHRASPC